MPSKAKMLWGHVVKQVLVVAAVALLAPLAATAQPCDPGSVCVVNSGGTLMGNTLGLSLTGSVVTQIGSLSDTNSPYLGSMSLTTGAFITGSGSLMAGGMFSGAGSSLTIIETSGPFTGTLFTGSFSSNINWTVNGLTLSHGHDVCVPFCTYTLSGNLNGTWANGMTYNGATTQLTFRTSTPWSGSLALSQGNTFVVTPEPASLGLMGTGLVGIAMVVKRRVRGSGV